MDSDDIFKCIHNTVEKRKQQEMEYERKRKIIEESKRNLKQRVYDRIKYYFDKLPNGDYTLEQKEYTKKSNNIVINYNEWITIKIINDVFRLSYSMTQYPISGDASVYESYMGRGHWIDISDLELDQKRLDYIDENKEKFLMNVAKEYGCGPKEGAPLN